MTTLALWLVGFSLSVAMESSCNFAGNWTSPPGKGVMRISIKQAQGSKSFTVEFGAGIMGNGNIDGNTVYFTNPSDTYVGVASTSPYLNYNTHASAPPCSFLTFNSTSKWCRFPYCGEEEPAWGPWPAPTPAPEPKQVLGGLTLVPQEARGAACLDGSAPGYWIRNATVSAESNKWVVHAQGGGWCYNEEGCAKRAKGSIGSSKSWGTETTCYGSCDGILSNRVDTNPDFYGWNAVFLGYCDGTSFSGNLTGVHQGLHYRGRANLDAVLDSLLLRGMAHATDLIFTGGSAGGLTTYLQLDYVASRMKAANTATKVRGLGDAGWFLDHAAYGTTEHVYTGQMQYLFNMSKSTTNAACMSALGEGEGAGALWKCFFAQYVFAHITTPVFIAEGMYDSWQLGNILKLGCGNPTPQKSCKTQSQLDAFAQYGRDMKATVTAALAKKPATGAFHSACIVHCETIFNEGQDRWNAWTIETAIGPKKPREVFADWFFGDKRYGGVTQAVDARPYPSNPSCPVFTGFWEERAPELLSA